MLNPVRILLIDDEENDFILTSRLLAQIETQRITVEWAWDYKRGLERILAQEHDIYLIDYRLDNASGLSLLKEAIKAGCTAPIILMTGQGDRKIDMEAMEQGAADYIIKGEITSVMLERSIRYAIERARNLRQLQESEFRYRDLFENAYDLIQSVSADGRFGYVNKRWLEMMEYSQEDLKKLTIFEVLRPDQAISYRGLMDRCRRGETVTDAQFVCLTKGGREIIIEGNITPQHLNGAFKATRGIFRDVTSRIHMEDALRSKEARLRAVLDSALDSIISIDALGNITEFNPAAEETFGYSREQIIGRPVAGLFMPERLRPEHNHALRRFLKSAEPSFMGRREEALARHADGHEFPVEIAITAVDLGGEKMYTAYLRDITERHKAEEALKQSEKRYRGVVDAQTELVCRYQPDTTLTFVNDAYCKYFGKAREELVGSSFLKLFPTEQHDAFIDHIGALIQRLEPITYEHEAISPAGERRWQQWTDRAISDSRGNVIELQSVGVDVTRLKMTEAELQKALEKEKELGELKSRFIAMASHEFRTPLTTIIATASFLEMAEERITPNQRLERLGKIQTAAHNMTLLLEDVLTYGKAEEKHFDYLPAPLDLHDFCTQIVEDIQAVSPEHTLTFQNTTGRSEFIVDDILLRHIITNLLSNAVKYSPKQGQIKFTLAADACDIILTVADDGIGIPEADQPHIFQPFHRAKNVRDYAGTGLGLAITFKAVAAHNGSITFTSEPNIGTTFVVKIPQVN